MLTKVYGALWIITLSVALFIFLTGSMTIMALVVLGFVVFGLTFMGMMGVLPAMVVHAHHDIANATPIADAAQNIELKRPSPDWLWHYRESVVGQFYDGIPMKLRMLQHVVRRSSSLHDVAAYLTLMGRKYDTSSKRRPVAVL